LLLGKTLASPRPQRLQLTGLASTGIVDELVRFNAQQVNVDTCEDLYYNPHGKHYTGMQNVLKGWCAAVRGMSKALYMRPRAEGGRNHHANLPSMDSRERLQIHRESLRHQRADELCDYGLHAP